MVDYTRLWETMKKKGVSQYRLITYYKVSAGQIGRLKKNMHVSTHTLEMLCNILQCPVEDILEIIVDPDGAEALKRVSEEPQDEAATAESASEKKSEKTRTTKKSAAKSSEKSEAKSRTKTAGKSAAKPETKTAERQTSKKKTSRKKD